MFSCAVLYVVSKRIGILKLQRKVTAAIKAGLVGQAEIGHRPVADGVNLAQVHKDPVHKVDVPFERPMRDEL